MNDENGRKPFHSHKPSSFGKPGGHTAKKNDGVKGKPGYADRKPPRRDGKPAYKANNQPMKAVPSKKKPAAHPAQNILPRRVALDTLMDVSRSEAYASLALEKRLKQSNLPKRDRAFITQIVYGTIENRIKLDWLIDRCLNSEEKALDPTVREILRMGAYQLFLMDKVPDMAAVDESVTLTRAMGLEALTGLTNAVLRRMIREKDQIQWPDPEKEPLTYLSVRYSVPEPLCGLLIDSLGMETAEKLIGYKPQERVVTIRMNGLRCTEDRLERLLSDEELKWEKGSLPGMYKVYDAGDLTALRGYENGLFTIQGESSVLAARMLLAAPGQTVLDACAAPGGKSAVIAEDMLNSGRIYAWDSHPHRVDLIRNTAKRLRLENIRPMARDATEMRESMNSTVDAALIDAPCSGTGVMSEKPDLKYRITEEGVQSLCATQKAILNAVAPMLKPGGTLVYSTCSVLPEENEMQVRSFLAEHAEYEVYPLHENLPEALRAYEGEFGLQLFPFRDGMDGFYICRLRRKKA